MALHKDENGPDCSVETPKTPLILMDNSSIKPSVYKMNMKPIFDTTEGETAKNEYDGPNSVPPPSGPPPTFPNMQNNKSPSTLPQYHLDNSIPPPNGPPPTKTVNIELQSIPRMSSLAPPNNGPKKQIHHENDVTNNSIVWMESIRTATSINQHKSATKGLYWLFIIAVIIIVSCLAMTSSIEHYILDIRIHLSAEGTYVWSFGWWENEFWFMDNAKCNACLFEDYTIDDIQSMKFPIPNTLVYAKNAGYLFISTVGIMMFWIICILFVLCERRNANEILYLNVCKCQIPQRAFVFFAFDVIHILSWLCIIYYSMLIVYGYIESHFYLENICEPGPDCAVYVIPHYGFCALLSITFPIVFCALSKTKGLDDKLTAKTYPLYFPKNAKKSQPGSPAISKNNIILNYLISSISATKMICILSFVMWVSFKDVGMISISFVRETTLKNTFSRYFQGIGLRNAHEIIDWSTLTESNSDMFSSGIITTWEPNDFTNETSFFNTIAFYWNFWICSIMAINMLLVAPYIIFVVQKYKSYKCMKLLIIWVTVIELLGHVGFMGMYYYEFFTLFLGHIQSELESDLSDMTGSVFDVSWYPDWGLLISILLCFYLLKLMRAIAKAT